MWRTVLDNSRDYFTNGLAGYSNPDPCPNAGELPYTECVSDCPGAYPGDTTDVGTLTQSAVASGDYYMGMVTFVDCRSGDFVINGTLAGPLTNLGAGYVLGSINYADQVTDDTDGDYSGVSYTWVTNEVLNNMIDPSTSYATVDNWTTAIFTDLMDTPTP